MFQVNWSHCTDYIYMLQNTCNVAFQFDMHTLIFPLQCSDSIGIFDAVWDRGGLGSVTVEDRQRQVH